MDNRRTDVRRKAGVLLTLMGLLGTLFGVLGPDAGAAPIGPGSAVGGFEIDATTINVRGVPTVVSAANFALDGTGTIDWATVPGLASRIIFDDEYQPGDDGDDLGFAGGTKEFNPAGWTCATDSGDDPPKDDIHWVLAYPSLSPSNSIVAFAFYRDKAQGNTNVVLELNRNPMDSCNGAAGRSVGDLILHFDFPGGDDPAGLEAYVWDGAQMVPFDVPAGVAQAATNRVALTIPATIQPAVTGNGLPTTLDARTFGEAAIDLVALRDALAADPDIGDQIDDDILECPGIGFANIRTRSSGNSDQSQLHDNFPQIPIDLSDCGSVKIKKVDDLGQPMQGIQFGLFASEAHALAGAPLAQLPTNPPQNLVCTTDADGICSFPKVPPGDYFINEVNLGDAYTADTDLPFAVHVDEFEDVDLTDEQSEWFVNTLRTGSVEITKVVVDGEGEPLTLTDPTYLDGITFELQDGGALVQKRGGGDATCTLELDDPSDAPSCTISDMPFGTYDVVEDLSTLPAGLSAGPSPSVTIDEDSPAVAEVTYENPADPLNLSIDKAGPDTANVGETITYTFTVGLGDLPFDTTDDPDLQPLTSVAVTEVVAGTDFQNRCTASPLALTGQENIGPLGNGWLEDGERWTYQCTHVVTGTDATDSDGTALKNRAQVEGTDRYGRTATDSDDHVVTILLPDLAVEKLAADGVDAGTAPSHDETIDAPGTASYTVTVANVGTGVAKNTTLTDTLPAGSWTVTLGSPDGDDVCPVGGNPVSGSFTCTFGDLAAGASKTVTVSRPVTIAHDCAAVLLNRASGATTFGRVDLDLNDSNDSSEASVTVRCPDVGVAKTAASSPISASERAEWSITVTNYGAGSAPDVHLVDQIPAGLTDLEVGGPDGDDCSVDDHTLTCDFGSIAGNDGAPGGPDTRVLTVSGLTDPPDCGTLPNTARVADDQGDAYVDSNPANNSASASVVVECPDLAIEKTAGSPTVSAGTDISYTITVTNHGPGSAFEVTLDDPLPTGPGLVWTDDSDDCTIVGGALSCTFGTLGDDESASVTVTSPTNELSCATFPNTATADASNDDSMGASATVVVQCPDITITKVADEALVSAGDPIGFTITVSNSAAPGTGTAAGVTLADPLPSGDGISWSIADQSGGADCGITGGAPDQQLACGPISLAPGASFAVRVISDTDPSGAACVGGALPNTATADASNDAPALASATITVQCPNLELTKHADAASVSAGEAIGFNLVVTNHGPGIARGVTLSDPLPGDVAWSIDLQLGAGACEITGALGTQVLACGPVDLGDDLSFSVHIVAATTELDCALYQNLASADLSNDEPLTADDQTLVKCPGLNITKDADDPDTVSAGDSVGFTVVVSNESGEGVGTAEAVTLDDPLPAGDGISWTIDSQIGDASCAISGDAPTQTLACGPVDLAPGQSFSVHIVSKTDPSAEACVSGELPNLATADADNAPAVTASDSITITCPDVTLTKEADAAEVDAGQAIGFTIRVENAGPGVAKDVVINDPLPSAEGVTWSISPPVEGCGILLDVLICEVGDLGAGASFEVHVSATTPGELGDPNLIPACRAYDNTAAAVVVNDADETANASIEVVCPLEITVEKDGPELAHRGDTITYTFDVTNSGAADLVTVELTDPICDDGTLLLVDDGDGDTTLAVGESWAYECTRVVLESDPDPLPNTATVVGTDVRARTTTDDDDHLVDLIAPEIDIDKTVDDVDPLIGQTVTFTYVVTNVGDTTLYDVEVVDDRLGPIGTIAELAPGASETLTATMVVAIDSPNRNVGTATGEDVLGKVVTDDDDATINITEGSVVRPPAPPLPRTGADAQRLVALSLALSLLGGALLLLERRKGSSAPRHLAGR